MLIKMCRYNPEEGDICELFDESEYIEVIPENYARIDALCCQFAERTGYTCVEAPGKDGMGHVLTVKEYEDAPHGDCFSVCTQQFVGAYRDCCGDAVRLSAGADNISARLGEVVRATLGSYYTRTVLALCWHREGGNHG